MIVNPCGFPYCKETDCENCKHNKITEVSNDLYKKNNVDTSKTLKKEELTYEF